MHHLRIGGYYINYNVITLSLSYYTIGDYLINYWLVLHSL